VWPLSFAVSACRCGRRPAAARQSLDSAFRLPRHSRSLLPPPRVARRRRGPRVRRRCPRRSPPVAEPDGSSARRARAHGALTRPGSRHARRPRAPPAGTVLCGGQPSNPTSACSACVRRPPHRACKERPPVSWVTGCRHVPVHATGCPQPARATCTHRRVVRRPAQPAVRSPASACPCGTSGRLYPSVSRAAARRTASSSRRQPSAHQVTPGPCRRTRGSSRRSAAPPPALPPRAGARRTPRPRRAAGRTPR
jgi:hypothetical protein